MATKKSRTTDPITMGLDISLSGTGLVVMRGHQVLRRQLIGSETITAKQQEKFPEGRIMPSGKFQGTMPQRIEFTRRKVMASYKRFLPLVVLIEAPAFSKNQKGTFDRYCLTGVIYNALHRKEAFWDVVAPRELKLWAAGDGNADKDAMIAAAAEAGFITSSNDLADAFHLASFGRDRTLGLLEPA